MEQLKITTIVETEDADKSIDGLNKGIETTEDSTNSLSESLDNMTGGAITGFKKMVSGVKRGVMAMKTLKGAIAATGIGALVIAVGTLYTFFTRNQKGADELNKIFAAVGATIDVLIDRIGTFGSGLWEILNGNFSAGLDILKGSFEGIGEEILKDSGAAYELEKAFQALEKRKIDFIVTEAKLRAEIEASRLAAEDTTKGIEAQADAIQRAIDLEKQLANEKADQTREELRIITERNALGETMNEDLQTQRELEAQLFEIESQRDTKLKELVARQRSLTAAKKGELDAETGGRGGEMEAMTKKGFLDIPPEEDPEVLQNQQVNDLMAKQNAAFENEKLRLEEAAAAESKRINQLKADAAVSIASQGLGLIAAMSENGSKVAKGAAAAQATFDTYAAAIAAFKTASSSPITTVFPGYPAVQAGLAVGFGLLQVKRILQTNTKRPSPPTISGGNIGGGSIPSRGQQDNRAPNFESLNFGVGGQQGAGFGSVRAVVVNSQFKNQQKVDARVQDLLSNG